MRMTAKQLAGSKGGTVAHLNHEIADRDHLIEQLQAPYEATETMLHHVTHCTTCNGWVWGSSDQHPAPCPRLARLVRGCDGAVRAFKDETATEGGE